MKRFINNFHHPSPKIFGLDFKLLGLLLVISAVTHWRWIFTSSPITHGDWGYLDNSLLNQLLNLPNIWNTGGFGGSDLVSLSFYPFYFLYGLLYKFGLTYEYSLKIIFLFPIIFISTISSFVLLKKILSNSYGAFIGTLVYSYNSYFMIVQNGHLTLMAAYSFAPLAIYGYLNVLQSRKKAWIVFTAIAFHIVSFYEFRGFYLTSILCLGLLFFYLIKKYSQPLTENLRLIFMGLLPFAGLTLLSAYWFLGALFLKGYDYGSVMSRGLFGDGYMNVLQSLALFHPFWAVDHIVAFRIQTIPIYFWLIPFLAFYGFWLNRRNFLVIYFGFLALVGIFLSKQSAEPFTNIYKYLYENFPGFSAFRESSKFYFVSAISYSVLIGAFFSKVVTLKAGFFNHRFTKAFIFILISAIFLSNTQGLISGKIGGLFVNRTKPESYISLRNFLDSQDQYFRIMWVPHDSKWLSSTFNKPKVSSVNSYYSVWNKISPRASVTVKKSEAEIIMDMFRNPKFDNLIDHSSIKYIILPKLDTLNDDDFFIFYGLPREYYLKSLRQLSYLNEVDLGLGDLQVFENTNFRPHLYLTNSEDVQFTPLEFSFLNPSQYQFTLPLEPSFDDLVFTENYHSQWQIYAGHVSWWQVLLSINKPLDIQTAPNNSGFIRFPISSLNPDSTYTIFFQPHAYVVLGFYISVVSYLIILIFILRKFYDN